MAANPPAGVGQPPIPNLSRSFADVVTSSQTPTPIKKPLDSTALPTLGSHKGYHAFFFSDPQLQTLSQAFPWTLVGKFSQGYNKANPKLGRPPLEDLELYFASLDLHGTFNLGLLDNRHILIRLSQEDDYLRLFSRMVWYVKGMAMRVFKWTPYFHVERESSLVPIWLSYPRLPVQFFQKDVLFSLASVIGLPLRLDSATASLKRPSVARLQVEIDLLKSRPDKIWIGMGASDGFWQRIDYENVPLYCTHCWHVGHSEALCYIHHPELKDAGKMNVPQSDVGREQNDSVGHKNPVIETVAEAPNPVVEAMDPVVVDATHLDAQTLNSVQLATPTTSATQPTTAKESPLPAPVVTAPSAMAELVHKDAQELHLQSTETTTLQSVQQNTPGVVASPAAEERTRSSSTGVLVVDFSHLLHHNPAATHEKDGVICGTKEPIFHGKETSTDSLSASQLFVSPQQQILPHTDELHTQNFQSSAEDEDENDEDEFFLDKQYIRDDFYLDHRLSKRQSRENFCVQFRRGRGRPPGSRRTYFDAVRTVSTRSHTVD